MIVSCGHKSVSLGTDRGDPLREFSLTTFQTSISDLNIKFDLILLADVINNPISVAISSTLRRDQLILKRSAKSAHLISSSSRREQRWQCTDSQHELSCSTGSNLSLYTMCTGTGHTSTPTPRTLTHFPSKSVRSTFIVVQQ